MEFYGITLNDTLVGSIIGGIISGVAGIVVALYSFRKHNKEEVREAVYVPLYDGIMKLELEPNFYGRLDETWYNLESHKKLRANKKIKNLYRKYEELRPEYNNLLEVWNSELEESQWFIPSIEPIFESLGLIDKGVLILKNPPYSASFGNFITQFQHILFDNRIKDSKELYEKLLEYSTKRIPNLTGWLKKIQDEKPELYVQLFAKLNEFNRTFHEQIDYEKLIKVRNELKNLIIEIRIELENRTKINH